MDLLYTWLHQLHEASQSLSEAQGTVEKLRAENAELDKRRVRPPVAGIHIVTILCFLMLKA